MQLWDDQLEAMRPTLREEADAFLASFAVAPEDPALTVAERVAAHRSARLTTVAPSAKAIDRMIPGPTGPLRVRTFVPSQVDAVMLHIHGGGFISGEPEMTDTLHEILSAELNLAFVSVDYRLAPEHPYPAGPDDCEAAAVWLLEHAKAEYGSDRLLIGGESAGGHLAACTLLRVRDRLGAIDRFHGANLVFGVYDLSRTPSQRGAWERPDILSAAGMDFFNDCFVPGLSLAALRDPDVSPLYADLRGLPPALFTVGADDHLVDDTLFMANRWRLAGNRTELLVYPEAPHGCIGMPSVGAHWFPRLIEFLRGCIKG
jgi:acetyl esterase/lipase